MAINRSLSLMDLVARSHVDEGRVASDTWVIGRHRIVKGDCLDAMATMEASSVDAIVTSPPYNLGIEYNSYDDAGTREAYLEWCGRLAEQFARVMTPGGSLFLNIGGSGRDPWIAFDVAAMFRRHLTLQNHIVWAKSLAIGDETFGHFKPINSRRFLNQNHETVLHMSKSGDAVLDRLSAGVPFKDKSNIERFGHAEDRRCAGNVWHVPYETVVSRSGKHFHPATFPVELAVRCLKLAGAAGVVLDPFLGSGTTLVAAERLGMSGIGLEMDGEYVEIALERVHEETAHGRRRPSTAI